MCAKRPTFHLSVTECNYPCPPHSHRLLPLPPHHPPPHHHVANHFINAVCLLKILKLSLSCHNYIETNSFDSSVYKDTQFNMTNRLKAGFAFISLNFIFYGK